MTESTQLRGFLQQVTSDLRISAGNSEIRRLKNNLNTMTVKYTVHEYFAGANGKITPYGSFSDIDTNTYLSTFQFDIFTYNYDTEDAIRAAVWAAIVSQAVNVLSYSTFTSADIFDMTYTMPSAITTSALSLSLVGTGATGTQVSATKASTVRANVSASTTATIGGASTSLITLKKCATNDSTEGNWTTVAVFENDQTISLAVILQSAQVTKGQLVGDIPAGWYVKLVNSGTGTHSESFISAEKTIYG